MSQPSNPTPYPYAYGPPQPPKKKHTLRNVLLILLGCFVLFVGGCVALIGSAADEASKALDEEAKNDKPTVIEEGAAFTHDIWKAQDGWTINAGGAVGMVEIKGLRVKNIGDNADTALLTFTLDRGNNVLAAIECSSPEAQPGQVVRMSCVGDEAPAGEWDTVTVKDAL